MKMDLSSRESAVYQDEQDPLSCFRQSFVIPSKADLASRTSRQGSSESGKDEPSVYLCGNSLGLRPVLARKYFEQYLDTWGSKGVYGHFTEIEDTNLAPWLHVDDDLRQDMGDIVGARPNEVAMMQTLTANLHLMMASFYKPTKERWKIILEGKAFPSDHVCNRYTGSPNAKHLIRRTVIDKWGAVRCRVSTSTPRTRRRKVHDPYRTANERIQTSLNRSYPLSNRRSCF